MTVVIGYVLAALIGLSLGLMGGGGSILTVPVFVYVLGYDPKLAIVMSFPVVGVTSFVGALSNWRAGNIDLKMAALFGAVTMSGAFVGARLARHLTGAVQLSILAVIILVAAASMFRSAQKPLTVDTGDEPNKTAALAMLMSVALLVGLTTGVVGIGGGFLVVPALVLLARVPMKQAVGTSLLVISMNCASGFIGSSERGLVPWEFVTGFAAVAVGGILVGTWLVRFVTQRTLKQAFAVFLLVIGTFILIKNRRVFSRTAMAPNLPSVVSAPASKAASTAIDREDTMIIHTPPSAFPNAAARPYPWSVAAKPAPNAPANAPTIRADDNGDVLVTVPPEQEQVS